MTDRLKHSGGYAMFLVAVVVALLALVLLTSARVQGDIRPNLRRLRDEVSMELEARTALARAEYLLLSEPIGPRSLLLGGARDAGAASMPMIARARSATNARIREIHLDGAAYRTGGLTISLQDEAGLYNLNAGDDLTLRDLWTEHGAGGALARNLASALNDYVDEDGLSRDGGGETDAYQRAGAPPPLNAALTNRWGAQNALGWRAAMENGAFSSIWDDVSARGSQREININTAPRAVLAAILRDARLVQAVLARRAQAPITGAEELEGLIGMRPSADGVVLAAKAGTSFRVRLRSETGRVIEGELTLAAAEADRPFYWREERRGRVNRLNGGDEDLEHFPDVGARDPS